MEGLLDTLMEDVTLQRKMISSEMGQSDGVISAEGTKKKKKRKTGKNFNALANVDQMEDVTLQRNLIGPEMVCSDTVMSSEQGKKKKKKRGKNLNDLVNANPVEDVTLQRNSIGSVMVCSDTVMSTEQGKKKKKKRGKNSNDLVNVDPVEDVTLQRNSIGSQMLHSDTVMSPKHSETVTSPKQGKKKRRKRGGTNLNSLVNVDSMENVTLQKNSIGSELVNADTVMSAKQGKKKKRVRGVKNLNALANGIKMQQPVDGTCLVTDSRLEQNDVEVEDCDNILKTSFGTFLSIDNNISDRDSGLIVDSRSTLGVKVNQVPEANVTPISMVVERNYQVCTNNGSKELSLDAPLAKKGKRKKGQENLKVLSSNNVQFNGLTAPSINSSSLDNELIQLATTSRGLILDSEVMLHSAELGLPVESIKELHQSTCGSNGKISCVEGEPFAADLKSTQEAGTNSLSKVVESVDQACTGTISISQGLNIGAMPTKRKKKKGRTKNQISHTSNDELHNNLNSLVSEIPIYNDSVQHPIMTGSEEVQHDAKLEQLDDIDKRNNDKHKKMHAETTPEADMDPIRKVAGDGELACSVDISEKMIMVPLQTQITKRKKKKENLNTLVSSVNLPSKSVMVESELMQHSTKQGISEGIHQNECATRDKNCGGKDISGLIDAKVNKISVSQEKVVDNKQGGKKRKRKIRGNNKILELGEGVISSGDISTEKQVKRATLNADQNAGIGRMFTGFVKKKLLVLDLNGLLADVVGDRTVTQEADGHVAGKKLFKRPFCEDFLQFCFNKFNVGVWSSRRKENVDKVLQVLMQGKDRSKLAFVWNQSHCSRTNFKTLENKGKPLFLKELSKLWDMKKFGDYNKSNTLLLDDSPYKALMNPSGTAIFPTPYQYQDQNDDALGPGGDIRVYLESLALARDVQKYVKQNPFGQKPITKSDPSWSFYSKVIDSWLKKKKQMRYKAKSLEKKRVARAEKKRVARASNSLPV